MSILPVKADGLLIPPLPLCVRKPYILDREWPENQHRTCNIRLQLSIAAIPTTDFWTMNMVSGSWYRYYDKSSKPVPGNLPEGAWEGH